MGHGTFRGMSNCLSYRCISCVFYISQSHGPWNNLWDVHLSFLQIVRPTVHPISQSHEMMGHSMGCLPTCPFRCMIWLDHEGMVEAASKWGGTYITIQFTLQITPLYYFMTIQYLHCKKEVCIAHQVRCADKVAIRPPFWECTAHQLMWWLDTLKYMWIAHSFRCVVRTSDFNTALQFPF